jgi:hypothetical protein
MSSSTCEESPTAGVVMLLDSLWKRYQGKPGSNSGIVMYSFMILCLLIDHKQHGAYISSSGHQNILFLDAKL